MKKINSLKWALALAFIIGLSSCTKNADQKANPTTNNTVSLQEMIKENGANADEASIALSSTGSANDRSKEAHFLYTETNEAGTNHILAYKINRDGTLNLKNSVASGGAGTGAGLGSQGALAIDKNHQWLFAVNAGANTVSSFKIGSDGDLTLKHTETTVGIMPNSVTVHGHLLFVLNHGSDNIQGFSIGADGSLTAIAGSLQPLSGIKVDAPQISFTPDGELLVVTEKATNNISTYKVKENGSTAPGIVTPSTGMTPFGFDFARGNYVVVSDAFGGAAGAGAATSYWLNDNGKARAINGSVANSQGAPCWVGITEFGRFAFVSNTGSNTVSSYYIAADGRLYLIDKAAGLTGNSPADVIVANNNFNVYALTAKSGTINQFQRGLFGGLKPIGSMSGIPATSAGLASF